MDAFTTRCLLLILIHSITMVVPNYDFLSFITDTKRYILSCEKCGYDSVRWYYNKCFFMYYNITSKTILFNPVYKQLISIDDLKNHFIELHMELDFYNEWIFEYLPDDILL